MATWVAGWVVERLKTRLNKGRRIRGLFSPLFLLLLLGLTFADVIKSVDSADRCSKLSHMRRPLSPKQKAYRQFLRTDFWKSIRAQAMERDGHKCAMVLYDDVKCGSADRLQVHHRFYRPKWEDTQLADLVTVCNECHRIEHGLYVEFPFEKLHYELQKKMCRIAEQISREEFLRLVDLAVFDEDKMNAARLLRMGASLKYMVHSGGKLIGRGCEDRLEVWATRKVEEAMVELGIV